MIHLETPAIVRIPTATWAGQRILTTSSFRYVSSRGASWSGYRIRDAIAHNSYGLRIIEPFQQLLPPLTVVKLPRYRLLDLNFIRGS